MQLYTFFQSGSAYRATGPTNSPSPGLRWRGNRQKRTKGLGFPEPFDGGRGWEGDIKRMLLAVERLRGCGWAPQFGSRAAILDTARWLDENY